MNIFEQIFSRVTMCKLDSTYMISGMTPNTKLWKDYYGNVWLARFALGRRYKRTF